VTRKPFRACSTAAVGALALTLAISGCGSTASHPSASINSPCNQVAAVLSDGPDPGADPVGYAAAQVLPLRELKLSAGRVRTDALALASAYAQFSSTKGSARAKAAVTQASHALDTICPGATQ
jgi:hypothetical protein